jgi:hypothetical protein
LTAAGGLGILMPLHVGRIGFCRRGNAHLRDVNRSCAHAES